MEEKTMTPYARSRINVITHLVAIIEAAGHSRYDALCWVHTLDLLEDGKEDHIYIMAARTDQSIARAFTQWLAKEQAERDLQTLRIEAALRGLA